MLNKANGRKENMSEDKPVGAEKIEPEVEEMIADAEDEMKKLKAEIARLENIVKNFKKMHSGWMNYKSQLGLADDQ